MKKITGRKRGHKIFPLSSTSIVVGLYRTCSVNLAFISSGSMCSVCLHVHCVHLFSVCVYMIRNLVAFTLISMLLCVGSVCPWPTSKATSHLEPQPFPSRLSQYIQFHVPFTRELGARKTGFKNAGYYLRGWGFWVCQTLFWLGGALGAVCLWAPSGRYLVLLKQSSEFASLHWNVPSLVVRCIVEYSGSSECGFCIICVTVPRHKSI